MQANGYVESMFALKINIFVVHIPSPGIKFARTARTTQLYASRKTMSIIVRTIV